MTAASQPAADMNHSSEDSLHAVALALPRVCVIAAVARNGAIGRNNALLWHLPADLAHFKRVTLGHPVIMGRRTWESLGRPLPGRRNLVVSRNPALVAPGAEVCGSLRQALHQCADVPDVFVIGGAALFAEALPMAWRLWLTEVHETAEADTFFPDWNRADFIEASREPHPAESGRPGFDVVCYERRV